MIAEPGMLLSHLSALLETVNLSLDLAGKPLSTSLLETVNLFLDLVGKPWYTSLLYEIIIRTNNLENPGSILPRSKC